MALSESRITELYNKWKREPNTGWRDFARAIEVEVRASHGQDEIGFARAVLAKWGAPAPVGVQPVAWAATSEDGDVEALGMNQSRRFDTPLYTHPSPPEGIAGWVSVDERLPQPNVEVLCAGQGWGNSFVTACYYDDERREWYPINTHWTDATGCAQYPTHWMPLPPSPTIEGESNG